MVAVFVRDENGGEIFRRAADAGEARADLARGKSGINQDAAIFRLDVGAVAGRAAAEDGEFDGHGLKLAVRKWAGKFFLQAKDGRRAVSRFFAVRDIYVSNRRMEPARAWINRDTIY